MIIKALRGVGVTAPIFGAGPAGTDSVGKGLGDAGDKFFAPMMWNWDLNAPGNKEFVAAYKAAYPSQPYPPANEQLGAGYVAAMILRQTLEKTAAPPPKNLREVGGTTECTNLPLP